MLETLSEMRLIFVEELRRFTRGKGYIILTLAVPTILLVVMGVILTVRAVSPDREEPKPIGIVTLSNDGAVASDDLQGFQFLAFSTRQEGINALSRGTVKEVFVIPEDYLKTGRVEWLHGKDSAFSGFDSGPGGTSSAAVRAYLRTTLAIEEMMPELLARAVVGAAFERVRIGENGLPVEEDANTKVGTIIVSLVFTLLLVLSIMIGAASLGEAVAEEKENHMIDVLLTSVKPLSLMAGKVLAIGTAQLIMITVWVGSVVVMVPRIADVIPSVFEFPIDLGLLVWVLAFFLAGYFVSSVIMAGIGAAATKVQEANQLAFLVIFPLLASVYVLGLILSNPGGGLALVLSFIPFTAPSAMMMRLAVDGVSRLESLASLAVIVATGMALLWASARVFRASLLMYGQRFSLRH
ncbi:MAG: ABC transporter permease, partial [Candidatus Bipolaricaulota bacterium]